MTTLPAAAWPASPQVGSPKSCTGQITRYLRRTNHVLPTGRAHAVAMAIRLRHKTPHRRASRKWDAGVAQG